MAAAGGLDLYANFEDLHSSHEGTAAKRPAAAVDAGGFGLDLYADFEDGLHGSHEEGDAAKKPAAAVTAGELDLYADFEDLHSSHESAAAQRPAVAVTAGLDLYAEFMQPAASTVPRRAATRGSRGDPKKDARDSLSGIDLYGDLEGAPGLARAPAAADEEEEEFGGASTADLPLDGDSLLLDPLEEPAPKRLRSHAQQASPSASGAAAAGPVSATSSTAGGGGGGDAFDFEADLSPRSGLGLGLGLGAAVQHAREPDSWQAGPGPPWRSGGSTAAAAAPAAAATAAAGSFSSSSSSGRTAPRTAGVPAAGAPSKEVTQYWYNKETKRWEQGQPPTLPQPAAPAERWSSSSSRCPGGSSRGHGGTSVAAPVDHKGLCRKFVTGACRWGDECYYSHSEEKLKRFLARPEAVKRRHIAECTSEAEADAGKGVCEFQQALAVRLALRFEEKPEEMLWSMAEVGLPAGPDQRATVKALLRLCHPDKCRHPDAKRAVQAIGPLLGETT